MKFKYLSSEIMLLTSLYLNSLYLNFLNYRKLIILLLSKKNITKNRIRLINIL